MNILFQIARALFERNLHKIFDSGGVFSKNRLCQSTDEQNAQTGGGKPHLIKEKFDAEKQDGDGNKSREIHAGQMPESDAEAV